MHVEYSKSAVTEVVWALSGDRLDDGDPSKVFGVTDTRQRGCVLVLEQFAQERPSFSEQQKHRQSLAMNKISHAHEWR